MNEKCKQVNERLSYPSVFEQWRLSSVTYVASADDAIIVYSY